MWVGTAPAKIVLLTPCVLPNKLVSVVCLSCKHNVKVNICRFDLKIKFTPYKVYFSNETFSVSDKSRDVLS